jgi:DNA-binding MarR family transcriptional regulator
MIDLKLLITMASTIIQDSQLGINNALREKKLGSAEANVLMFLYSNGDGVMQDDIVAGVEVSKPAISRTIRSLERKGYITRKRNASDRRSHVIRLTDKARQEQEFIQRQYANLVAVASRGISEAQAHEFLAMFQQVAANFEDYRKSMNA